jgi:hypothetical protein
LACSLLLHSELQDRRHPRWMYADHVGKFFLGRTVHVQPEQLLEVG